MTGEQVKAFRQRQGLNQTQLAAALGVGVQTVARWEAGQTAPPAFLGRALADLGRERAAMDAERMEADAYVLARAERMPRVLPE